jgi:hypothetical protein
MLSAAKCHAAMAVFGAANTAFDAFLLEPHRSSLGLTKEHFEAFTAEYLKSLRDEERDTEGAR